MVHTRVPAIVLLLLIGCETGGPLQGSAGEEVLAPLPIPPLTNPCLGVTGSSVDANTGFVIPSSHRNKTPPAALPGGSEPFQIRGALCRRLGDLGNPLFAIRDNASKFFEASAASFLQVKTATGCVANGDPRNEFGKVFEEVLKIPTQDFELRRRMESAWGQAKTFYETARRVTFDFEDADPDIGFAATIQMLDDQNAEMKKWSMKRERCDMIISAQGPSPGSFIVTNNSALVRLEPEGYMQGAKPDGHPVWMEPCNEGTSDDVKGICTIAVAGKFFHPRAFPSPFANSYNMRGPGTVEMQDVRFSFRSWAAGAASWTWDPPAIGYVTLRWELHPFRRRPLAAMHEWEIVQREATEWGQPTNPWVVVSTHGPDVDEARGWFKSFYLLPDDYLQKKYQIGVRGVHIAGGTRRLSSVRSNTTADFQPKEPNLLEGLMP